MSGPRETAYDNEISPLMDQIIDLCKQHQIPLVAVFELDTEEGEVEPLLCTTSLLPGERCRELDNAFDAVRPRRPIALQTTITTNDDGSKVVRIGRVL